MGFLHPSRELGWMIWLLKVLVTLQAEQLAFPELSRLEQECGDDFEGHQHLPDVLAFELLREI
jgi:hypothetical protein